MVDLSRLGRVKAPLVRAWFDTVFGPILYGIRMEAHALETGNLSWRYREKRFATLVPFRSHLLREAVANYDQAAVLIPTLRTTEERHDQSLDRLWAGVNEFHGALVNQATFQTMAASVIPADASAIFGPVPQQDYGSVLAEYIINNVHSLPGYYSTAKFWNQYSEAFFALRDREDLRQEFDAVMRASQEMATVVKQAISFLESARNELSLEFGVPIFEMTAS